MMFEINEKVQFLYETGGGKVIGFKQNQIIVMEDTGFERIFEANELVKIQGHFPREIDINHGLKQTDELHKVDHNVVFERENQEVNKRAVWEIDLHIEELTEKHRALTHQEILTKQLTEFKSFFKDAKANHIRKIIVIHGIGDGVLKFEVRSYLDKQEGCEYYDANFSDYGKGATAIEFSRD